jgi:hypothetical protein
MFSFNQKQGQYSHNDQLLTIAYAGRGEGKNNPDMQFVEDTDPNPHDNDPSDGVLTYREGCAGPLPRGWYTIGGAFTHPRKGPLCMRLYPDRENVMNGREGFMIHGDSIHHPGEASDGCICASREAREITAAAVATGDNRLEVF